MSACEAMQRRSDKATEVKKPRAGRSPSFLRRFVASSLILLITASVCGQSTSIIHSPHNLSALGPGPVQATSEQQVCIFCHAPHHAAPVQPLWNRDLPVNAYTVYSSNSLNAAPGQPTGSSKLCLSCHDGTIALGSVKSRGQVIVMAGGLTTMPPGRSNLGTDLSDDHPISFRYDENLASHSGKIVSPSQLPPNVQLDYRQEMQCTTCHNAHNNQFGKFLVMDNSGSQLCRTCHTHSDTTIPGHLQCSSCHQPHSAPSGPYLLRGQTVTQTCLTCHSGVPGAEQGPNIASELNKISRHDTDSTVNLIDHVPNNVVCADCHEPHTMQPGTAAAPEISPRMGRVSGVNAAGALVANAQYEYELCFKCHGDQTATQPRISRQVMQTNRRLQTAPSAVSYHPVQAPSGRSDSPSLRAGVTPGSMIYCTDCHGSNSSKAAGGGGADGPHGSSHSGLLIANYETLDGTIESPTAYALCYRCHDRNSILANQSFPLHREHIVDHRTSCSVCHEPHGISSAQAAAANHSGLMNFDTSVVTPDPVTGRLEFRHTGERSGECYLSCHNVAHSPKSY